MRAKDEILDAVNFIKDNSPKLHLYVCGKLLERRKRGTFRIRVVDARKTLGSIFHISKNSQLKILKELESYKLILRISNKEYLIPITPEEYETLFNKPLNM